MVSVIMPAYNAEKYIGRAIESILKQTYTDFELLIIEDGSSDRTLDVIKSFTDKRIKLLINSENRGISYSTNIGLKASRGDYIALLDDDDMAAEKRLEIQVSYMDIHPEIDILGGRSIIIDEKDNYLKIEDEPRNNPKYLKALLLFKRVDFRNGTTMIRNEFIKKYNLYYHENCYGMQDHKFFIDSSKVGNISSVNQIVLFSRIHEMNETKKVKISMGKEREERYFEFQKDSLERSGYKIDDNSLSLIRKIFSEEGTICRNYREFKELIYVLIELLKQADEMKADYFCELEHLCKSVIAEQTIKMKDFTVGLYLGNENMK